jgi:hypothetical protein
MPVTKPRGMAIRIMNQNSRVAVSSLAPKTLGEDAKRR